MTGKSGTRMVQAGKEHQSTVSGHEEDAGRRARGRHRGLGGAYRGASGRGKTYTQDTRHERPEAQTIPTAVDFFLPADSTRILQELVATGKAYAAIAIIHGALWMMRAREMTPEEQKADLNSEIEASLDAGPPIEVTPEFWQEFARRSRERLAWIQTLSEQHKIGNTLLPEKL
jgi:Arc/MetJ-type ribon-helix-helix transcriptional regulator